MTDVETNKKTKVQLNVPVARETRRQFNRILEHESVTTNSDALELAIDIAYHHLLETKEINP